MRAVPDRAEFSRGIGSWNGIGGPSLRWASSCSSSSWPRRPQAGAVGRERDFGHVPALARGGRAGRSRARQGGRGDRGSVRGGAQFRLFQPAVARRAAKLRLEFHAAGGTDRNPHQHQDAACGDVAGPDHRAGQAEADRAAHRGSRVHPDRRRQMGVSHAPGRRYGAGHSGGGPGVGPRRRPDEARGCDERRRRLPPQHRRHRRRRRSARPRPDPAIRRPASPPT